MKHERNRRGFLVVILCGGYLLLLNSFSYIKEDTFHHAYERLIQ